MKSWVCPGRNFRTAAREKVFEREERAVALFGILLIGIAFSQLIALGITKPILRLAKLLKS